jgi:hypothetical protein
MGAQALLNIVHDTMTYKSEFQVNYKVTSNGHIDLPLTTPADHTLALEDLQIRNSLFNSSAIGYSIDHVSMPNVN